MVFDMIISNLVTVEKNLGLDVFTTARNSIILKYLIDKYLVRIQEIHDLSLKKAARLRNLPSTAALSSTIDILEAKKKITDDLTALNEITEKGDKTFSRTFSKRIYESLETNFLYDLILSYKVNMISSIHA